MRLGELVRHQPRDGLALQLYLVVVAANRDEALFEGLIVNAIIHPLHCDSAAVFDHFGVNGRALGESGKHENHAKSVVHVAKCVVESGIALEDDVVEAVDWFGQANTVNLFPVATARGVFDFFQESLDILCCLFVLSFKIFN